MAPAGTTPPEGFSSADVSYLQSALQADLTTQDIYSNTTRGYSPNLNYTGPDVDLPREAPARLTDIPTSSTNAARPRTVAAGYDAKRKVLTVMFRDGTLVNYYKVEPGTWENFHNSISKGRPWLNHYGPGAPGELVNHEYGPADISSVDPATLSEIYRIARSAQVRYTTRKNTVNRNFSNGRGRYAYKPGKNPATAGKASRKPNTSRKP